MNTQDWCFIMKFIHPADKLSAAAAAAVERSANWL